ncbi:MAG: right-handed parallel beta-helix repeat-containing protein, partial [Nanoarchaeota archaeon]
IKLLKTDGKYLGIIILSLMTLFLLTACDSGSSGDVLESETYSSSLEIGYLEEEELTALSISVGEEIYSDLKENYQDGFVNLDLAGLETEVNVVVKHQDLHFTESEFKVDQKDDGKIIGIYTTHVIVDETAGERFTLPETEPSFPQDGHKYTFYPGRYLFGRDFEIYNGDVTVESKTGSKNTIFEFKEDKYVKIGADNINFKGISIETIQAEDGTRAAFQINQGTKNIRIENSDFEGVFTQPDVSGITIKNNIIHDGIYQGIHLDNNNSDVLIEANEIYDNFLYWSDKEDFGYEGIYVDEGSKKITIKDNIIRDNYGQGIALVDSTANITNNTLKNNDFQAILLWPGSKAVVENNLIKDNNSQAIYLLKNSEAEIKYNEIKNNAYGIQLRSEETVSNTIINYNNLFINDDLSLFARKDDPENPDESIPTDNILNAENNWWGSNQLNEDNLEVKNESDKLIIRGGVDYKPYAAEEIKEAGLKLIFYSQ